jgi:hypothetical protein
MSPNLPRGFRSQTGTSSRIKLAPHSAAMINPASNCEACRFRERQKHLHISWIFLSLVLDFNATGHFDFKCHPDISGRRSRVSVDEHYFGQFRRDYSSSSLNVSVRYYGSMGQQQNSFSNRISRFGYVPDCHLLAFLLSEDKPLKNRILHCRRYCRCEALPVRRV